eukprot:TRINITY_DN5581_c0_g2_i1.p1 TRINITY_DN5581_c0_g2~~TRINITY_DN5581_c0_g2_i1.p1  ORF type:complete len:434 (+),score=94.70 TRINITY_DN5581_c0_g2_i1:68-1369(+)
MRRSRLLQAGAVGEVLRRAAAAHPGGPLDWLLQRVSDPGTRELLHSAVREAGRPGAGPPLLPAELAAGLHASRDWAPPAGYGAHLATAAARADLSRWQHEGGGQGPSGLPADDSDDPDEAELSMPALERAVEVWLDDPQQEQEAAALLASVTAPAAAGAAAASQGARPVAWPWQPRGRFGVVQLRHASTPEHAKLWRESYRSLRTAYPKDTPVVVVDDGSTRELAIEMGAELRADRNAAVVPVPPPLRGRGELLLWWALWALRPFDTALLLHDSMLCVAPHPLPPAAAAAGAYPLWHFSHDYSCTLLDAALLCRLRAGPARDAAVARYLSPEEWKGCFGGAAFASWAIVDSMQRKYALFDLLPHVTSRTARMSAERALGCLLSLCCPPPPGAPASCFGDIIVDYPRPWGYSWSDYVAEGQPKLAPIIKIWAGR